MRIDEEEKKEKKNAMMRLRSIFNEYQGRWPPRRLEPDLQWDWDT